MLYQLRRYDDAIANYEKAIELKPDYHQAWYDKACCYALQGNVDLTIENLQQAINLCPRYREMARTDSDFESIRVNEQLQALIQS